MFRKKVSEIIYLTNNLKEKNIIPQILDGILLFFLNKNIASSLKKKNIRLEEH